MSEQDNPEMKSETFGAPAVSWDETGMVESYANVATISATREEFSLLFGTQRGWRQDPSKEVPIALTNRVILNPYLAKRFQNVLSRTLEEYERRYGKIDI